MSDADDASHMIIVSVVIPLTSILVNGLQKP